MERRGGLRPRLNCSLGTKTSSDGQQKGDDDVVKPKGSNPFGEARPREELEREGANSRHQRVGLRMLEGNPLYWNLPGIAASCLFWGS
ncbi:hypothetical protein Leryth_027283 [Lithospermum erythrorhizon]|nr:hypothetical protein Leryth_027283 [Lithospermum erythrorhizon]